MKSIGPYIVLREMSSMTPRVSDEVTSPERLGAILWATDRLTGMPVLLHPVRKANRLPELPRHPHILPFSDILQTDEQTYLVTQLDLQATPATDPALAAHGVLTALTVLHELGLVHGRLDPSELWSIDGRVVLAGAGLVEAGEYYTAFYDLHTLADVLEELGELPSILDVLRTTPNVLTARDVLGMLEDKLPRLEAEAQDQDEAEAAADFPVPDLEDWDMVEEESKSTEWPASGIRNINTHLNAPVPTVQEATHSRLLIEGLPSQPVFLHQVLLTEYSPLVQSSDSSEPVQQADVPEKAQQRVGQELTTALATMPELLQVMGITQQVDSALSVSVMEGRGSVEYFEADSLAIELTFSHPQIRAVEGTLYNQSATSSEVLPITSTGQASTTPVVEEESTEQKEQAHEEPEIISERSAVPSLSLDFEESHPSELVESVLNPPSAEYVPEVELDLSGFSEEQVVSEPTISAEAGLIKEEETEDVLTPQALLEEGQKDDQVETHETESLQDMEPDHVEPASVEPESVKTEKIELEKPQSVEKEQVLEAEQPEKEAEPTKVLLAQSKSDDSEQEQAQQKSSESEVKHEQSELEHQVTRISLEKKTQDEHGVKQADQKQQTEEANEKHTTEVVVHAEAESSEDEPHKAKNKPISLVKADSVATEKAKSVVLAKPKTPQQVKEKTKPTKPKLKLEKSPNETPQQQRRRENLILAEHEREEGEARRQALAEKRAAESETKEDQSSDVAEQAVQARNLKPIRMGFDSGGQWKVLRDESSSISTPIPAKSSFAWVWSLVGVLVLVGGAGGYYVSQNPDSFPWWPIQGENQTLPKVATVSDLPCCKVNFKISGKQNEDVRAMLRVAQAPAKAQLAPGTSLGEVPGQLDLPTPGVYSLRVKAKGYTPHLVDVKVPTAQVVQLKLKEP